MPTSALIKLTLEVSALQLANMQQLSRFDDLRSADDLAEANKCGAALEASLQQQILETERCNEEMAGEGQPLQSPRKELLDVMLQRADIVESLRQYDDAESLRLAAKKLAQDMGGSEHAERQRQLAGSLFERGKIGEAFSALYEARDLFSATGADPLSKAQCLADLAQAYEWLRDFDRARKEIKEAKALLDKINIKERLTASNADEISGQVKNLGAQATDLFQRGDPLDAPLEQMLRLQNGVRFAAVLSKICQCEARCKQFEARCLIIKGESDKARALFAEARALFEQARPTLLSYAHPALDYQFAKMLVDSGDCSAGLEKVAELEPQFRSGVLRRKLAGILDLKARALQGLDKGTEALTVIQKALEALVGFEDPDLKWKILAREAEIRASLGQSDKALIAYHQATELIDLLRRAPLGFRLDSLSLSNKIPVFRRAIALACEMGDARESCRLIEMLKSRQLAATLGAPGGSGVESKTSRRIDEITDELTSIEYQREDPEHEFEKLVEERNELRERMCLEDPRWHRLSYSWPLNLDTVLETLRERQAAVTLYVDEQILTAVLLFEGPCQVFSYSLTADTLKRVHDYRENLVKGEKAIKKSFDPSEFGLALELLLPEKMIDALLSADSLVVVPHGALHFLPWAMIDCRGKPLCTYLAVSVLPNLSVLTQTSELPAAAERVALVGASPARQAPINVAEQCSAVAKIYSMQESPPSDAVTKTRDTFMRLLHGPQRPGEILYIACHGAFNLADPMSSSLSLEDGRIDAASIVRGRCAFDEVVLSACETGQRASEVGDLELAGDEILGLIGSFLEAGAKSVLASITEAKDSAALAMMKLYHEGRARGEPPRHALRNAQVAMYKKKSRYPVHEWGGFTLFGSR